MYNKKDRIYSLRQLMPEIMELDEKKYSEEKLTDIIDYNYRRIKRYYDTYKKMEYYRDRFLSKDNNIYEEDKDMIVKNMQKIYDHNEKYGGKYYDFVKNANKKDFNMRDFLELMQDEGNQEIFKELYLDSLHELDFDYYGTSHDEIDKYIDKVYSKEVNDKYSEVLDGLDLIYTALSNIRDTGIKRYLLTEIDKALEEVSKEVVIYKNKEHYMQRLMEAIPQSRFVTRPHELPEELFDKYASINGFGNLFPSEYNDAGYQKDKITDEVLDEIIEDYFKSLKEKDENLDKVIRKLENSFNIVEIE